MAMNTTIYKQCIAILDEKLPPISNLSNLLALLFYEVGSINWIGLYLYDAKNQECILGPFQGRVACTHIPFGKGVVGACCKSQAMIVVKDVHQFQGHIACDSASRSELVYPIKKSGKLVAILDIDSPILDRFSKEDQIFFSKIGDLISSLLERSTLIEDLIQR